ncbi:MAG: tetratricopeptide repeat protein [Caulobacteraceae bacterium]
MDPRFAEAAAALQQGRDEEAERLVDAALDDGATPAVAVCESLAAGLFQAKRMKAAERVARAGVAQQPKNRTLWNTLGVALRRQNRLAEALEAIDRAIKLAPKEAGAWSNKGNIHLDMGDDAKAIEVFTRLIRLHPNAAEYHRMLGVAHRQAGDLAKAEARLAAAVRIQPKLVAVWIDRIAMASSVQKFDEALAIVDRGLEANPGAPRLMEARAQLLRRSGRRADAEAELRGGPGCGRRGRLGAPPAGPLPRRHRPPRGERPLRTGGRTGAGQRRLPDVLRRQPEPLPLR